MITLRQGRPEDARAVQALLQSSAMGVALDPGECLLAEEKGTIAGLARIEYGDPIPYLRPIAISPHHQHRGIGRQLLETLIKDLDELRVVARGEAVGFYSAFGFKPMDWESVYAGYQQECAECPDHDSCRPVPMLYHHSTDKTPSQAQGAAGSSSSSKSWLEEIAETHPGFKNLPVRFYVRLVDQCMNRQRISFPE